MFVCFAKEYLNRETFSVKTFLRNFKSMNLVFAMSFMLVFENKTEPGHEKPTFCEAVLTCTHNLCFEQKQENINFFPVKFFIFTTKKNFWRLHGHWFIHCNLMQKLT